MCNAVTASQYILQSLDVGPRKLMILDHPFPSILRRGAIGVANKQVMGLSCVNNLLQKCRIRLHPVCPFPSILLAKKYTCTWELRLQFLNQIKFCTTNQELDIQKKVEILWTFSNRHIETIVKLNMDKQDDDASMDM